MRKRSGVNGEKIPAVVVVCKNLKALKLDDDSVKIEIVEQSTDVLVRRRGIL